MAFRSVFGSAVKEPFFAVAKWSLTVGNA